MDKEHELSVEISAKISDTTAKVKELVNSLKSIKNAISDISKDLDKLGSADLSKVVQNLDGIAKASDKLSKSLSKNHEFLKEYNQAVFNSKIVGDLEIATAKINKINAETAIKEERVNQLREKGAIAIASQNEKLAQQKAITEQKSYLAEKENIKLAKENERLLQQQAITEKINKTNEMIDLRKRQSNEILEVKLKQENVRLETQSANLGKIYAQIGLIQEKKIQASEIGAVKLDQENIKLERQRVALERNKLSLEKLRKTSTGLQGTIRKLWDIGKIYVFWNYTKRIRDAFGNMLKNSIDYIETANLFEKSMRSSMDTGYGFIDKLSNSFGIATESLMKYQATFKNVIGSLGGITEKTSYDLSETLTRMAIDYASLYNFSIETSMEKFQSALVGQTKAIRDVSGMDITQATLSSVAVDLGIEKSIRNMNEVERRLLRIIALQRQMKATQAMGDYADTIESVANQLKVMENQLKELGVWIGNAFINKIEQVMPYINGFIMALKEVMKLIAIFFGYEAKRGTATDDPLGVGDTTDNLENLTDTLGSASSAIDNYKNKLQGFDELNVITTPSESGTGIGVGNVDPAILNALAEYDDIMSNVRMKAIDIKEAILDWLGITQDANGELKFSSEKLMKNLVKWWNGLNNEAKFFLTLGIIGALSKMLTVVKNLTVAIGNSGLFSPLKDLFNTIKVNNELIHGHASAIDKVTSGYVNWMASMQTDKLKAIETGTKGIVTALSGGIALNAGIKDMTQNGTSFINVVETIIGSVLTAIGTFEAFNAIIAILGVTVTATTGVIGIIVSVLATAGIALVSWLSHKNKIDDYAESLEKVKKASNDNAIASIAEAEATKKLSKELEKYIDENGKIKKGYEERANFIINKLNSAYKLEYKLIDGVITRNGEEVKTYKEIEKAIDDVMLKLKAQALLEAKHESYVELLKENIKLNKERKQTEEEINKNYEYYNELVYNGKMTQEEAQKAFEKASKEKMQQLNEINEKYKLNDELIQEYSNLEYAIQTENSDKMKQIIIDNLGETALSTEKTYTHMNRMIIGNLEDTQEKMLENNKVVLENLKQRNKDIAKEINSSIETTTNDTITKVSSEIDKFQSKLQNTDFKVNIQTQMSDITSLAKGAAINFSNVFKGYLTLPKITLENESGVKMPYANAYAQFKAYATGGFPDVGELFLAREAGAEFVGRMGNRNVVANNDQIVSAVSAGVANAVARVMGSSSQDIKLIIDGRQVTNVVTNRQSRELARVGG